MKKPHQRMKLKRLKKKLNQQKKDRFKLQTTDHEKATLKMWIKTLKKRNWVKGRPLYVVIRCNKKITSSATSSIESNSRKYTK